MAALLITVLLHYTQIEKSDAYSALTVALQAAATPILVAFAVRQLRRVRWRLQGGIWHWALFIFALLAVYDFFKLYKKTSGDPHLLAWMVTGFAVGVFLLIVRWRFFFGDEPARTSREASR